tara:strand:- start:275 stop:568 length:294 start_codon:yes stop_codon:yes gene_type:complete
LQVLQHLINQLEHQDQQVAKDTLLVEVGVLLFMGEHQALMVALADMVVVEMVIMRVEMVDSLALRLLVLELIPLVVEEVVEDHLSTMVDMVVLVLLL